jgi:hypothetical protein
VVVFAALVVLTVTQLCRTELMAQFRATPSDFFTETKSERGAHRPDQLSIYIYILCHFPKPAAFAAYFMQDRVAKWVPGIDWQTISIP